VIANGASKRRWVLAACAIVVIGLAASITASLLWRASVRSRERQTFQTSAANISGTLKTQLRRDTDFVQSARAVATKEPNLQARDLNSWLVLLEDHRDQPTGDGALLVRDVPAKQLSSYQARRNSDPTFRKLVAGHVASIALDGRADYCLLAGGSADLRRSSELTRALEGDSCDPRSSIGGYRHDDSTRAKFTQAITDSDHYGAYSIALANVRSLIVEAPVYRSGAPVETVAQRRAAVLGWVLGSFDIPSLMKTAIAGDRGLGVTLYHANSGLTPQFIGRMGATANAHAFTHEAMLQVDGTWIVQVRGTPVASGPSANVQGLVVLLGGVIATLLLAALVLVLARSRELAMGMVAEKTGQLRHQALHDALTGLPNRVLALDRVEQMLARARRQDLPVAALYVDIDDFKNVNDSFGHAAGDELLRIVATRLSSVVREGDTAARLGGDEFVVLVEGSTLDAGPELVAERLLDALRQPCDMRGEIGRELSISASIGVAFGLRESADELLRDADLALYAAKAAGRNRYVLFESSMQTAAQDRLRMQMDLADAVAQGRLLLVYQPTFDLQSGRVSGVEALLRWQHPTRGTLQPADFIPLAESTGLIVPIGGWVLEEACRQAAKWNGQGHRIGVSVNVAARQLDTEDLLAHVRNALADSGLEPGALTLEVTESTLMRDPEAAIGRLRALKQLGVRIAIDDFGSGYSSLAYLREFPADALKIDRSFVSEIAASDHSATLIRTLVQLGSSLGIETLAEGIEDHAQLVRLQREQCDQGQGFLFSRPLDVRAVEAFLEAADGAAQPQTAQ
jgi:diguanylate cyclase (GGDEF)-like protein